MIYIHIFILLFIAALPFHVLPQMALDVAPYQIKHNNFIIKHFTAISTLCLSSHDVLSLAGRELLHCKNKLSGINQQTLRR